MTGSPSALPPIHALHRLLFWAAALLSLLLPLVFAPTLAVPFQLPKLLLFRLGFLVLLGAWLGGSLALKRFWIPRSAITLPLILLVFLAFLSIFPAADRGKAAAAARDTAFCVACFLMLASLPGAPWRRRLAGALALGAGSTALLGLIQLLAGPRMGWLPSTQGGGLVGDVSSAAVFVALALPLALGLSLSSPRAGGSLAWSLGAGMMAGYLVLARCRAAWLGALVSLVWLAAIRLSRRKSEDGGVPPHSSWRPRALAAFATAAGITLLGIYGAGISLVTSAPSLRTAELMGWDLRLDVWRVGTSMALSRPLGAGAANWPVAFAGAAGQAVPPTRFGSARLPSQAGNEYLEIAGELGLVGLFLALWAAGWLLREGWRRSRQTGDGQTAGTTAALGGLLASALLASVLRDQPTLWAAILLGALVFSPGAAGDPGGVPDDRKETGEITVRRRRPLVAALLGLFTVLAILTTWDITRGFAASRWLRIGRAACARRDFSTALPALTQASKGSEFQFEARYLAGTCALEARHPELAEPELDAARHLNPADPTTLLFLARSLRAQGKMIEAVAVAEKAARFWPHDEAVNFLLGGLREATGNRKGAFEAYQQAAGANPDSAKTYLRLGDIFLARDNGFQAVGAYLKAASLDPYLPDASLKLGSAYLKQGDYNSAIQVFQNLLDFQPENVEAQVNLARTYSGMRQYCDARRILEKVAVQLKGSAQEPALRTALADLATKCESGGS